VDLPHQDFPARLIRQIFRHEQRGAAFDWVSGRRSSIRPSHGSTIAKTPAAHCFKLDAGQLGMSLTRPSARSNGRVGSAPNSATDSWAISAAAATRLLGDETTLAGTVLSSAVVVPSRRLPGTTRAAVTSPCQASNLCDGWLLNAGHGGQSGKASTMRTSVM
jgi:hypothetical protein